MFKEITHLHLNLAVKLLPKLVLSNLFVESLMSDNILMEKLQTLLCNMKSEIKF